MNSKLLDKTLVQCLLGRRKQAFKNHYSTIMSYYRTTRHKNRVKNLHNKHTACYKNRFEKSCRFILIHTNLLNRKVSCLPKERVLEYVVYTFCYYSIPHSLKKTLTHFLENLLIYEFINIKKKFYLVERYFYLERDFSLKLRFVADEPFGFTGTDSRLATNKLTDERYSSIYKDSISFTTNFGINFLS